MVEGIQIRRGRPTDASDIARVHVESWRAAYRGILADETLAQLSIEQRLTRWKDWFENKASLPCWVAEDAASVIGFATGGPNRSGEIEADSELYAIYVAPAHYRRSVGRSLFLQVMEDLVANGYRSMLVWVLEENALGRRFYEKLGGEQVGSKAHDVHGHQHVTVGYMWRDLILILGSRSPTVR